MKTCVETIDFFYKHETVSKLKQTWGDIENGICNFQSFMILQNIYKANLPKAYVLYIHKRCSTNKPINHHML